MADRKWRNSGGYRRQQLGRRLRLEALEDRRMLTTPVVQSVTPNDLSLTDADVGAGSFELAIVFDDVMQTDGSAEPVIAFSPLVNSSLTFSTGSWSVDAMTYTAIYDLADVNAAETAIDVTITGAENTLGEVQAPGAATDLFGIDTKNPTVNITPSYLEISDADAGSGTFSISVDFSEAMIADGTADPTLNFNPTAAGTLTFNSDGWSVDGKTYTVAYDVADAGVTVPNIDVTVSGARDATGNLQVPAAPVDVFSIDTENPTVVSATPSVMQITDAQVGTGGYSIDVVFSEAMITDGTFDPMLVFSPTVASTLMLNSGLSNWTNDTTYKAVYDVTEAMVVGSTSNLTVSLARDDAGRPDRPNHVGNLQVPRTFIDLLPIDTKNPTVTSITPSILEITDADVGNDTFKLTVVFSEEMIVDSTADPLLTFTPTVNSTLTLDSVSSRWLNNTTYLAVYDVTDAGVMEAGIDVWVSLAKDVAGNEQDPANFLDVFSIDTENPLAIELKPSILEITDADVGDKTFSIDVVFSEAMTIDGTATPQLDFTPSVASTLTLDAASSWLNSTTYRAFYDVADAGVMEPNTPLVTLPIIEVTVRLARDDAGRTPDRPNNTGNLQVRRTFTDVFAIDTFNPTVVDVTPSVLQITDAQVGPGGFSIDVVFGEAMTTDGSADPDLTFAPTVASALTLDSKSWSADGKTYTAFYDVGDTGVTVPDIDVTVSHARDDAGRPDRPNHMGNLQVLRTFLDVFSIDTVPLVTTVDLFIADNLVPKSFFYDANGTLKDSHALAAGNDVSRGAAAASDGSKFWVVDVDKNIYVYDANQNLLGQWSTSAFTQPEGIAVHGSDLWIVSRSTGRVYFFAGGANFVDGDRSPTSSFALHHLNARPYGLTTDGSNIWITNDATDMWKVFKYDVSGASLGRWELDRTNLNPRGITLDPSNPNDILVVDSSHLDRIYRYADAVDRTSGGRAAIEIFMIDSANDSPRGLAAFGVSEIVSADFDSDGDVDGSDFLAWQRGFATPNATLANGDADNDNDVDGDDLLVWESSFGSAGLVAASSELSAVVAEAEPDALVPDALISTANLFDAALAEQWLGMIPGKEESFVVDERDAGEVAYEAANLANDFAIATRDDSEFEALITSSLRSESEGEVEFAFELLESAFGEISDS